MAAPINAEVGFSGSASSAAKTAVQAATGDVSVSTGGSKQTQTLYIVAGIIAFAVTVLAGVILWNWRKR